MKPLPVSVVIPCYNCADTIGRAVDSVLGQSHAAAELILVDDGSADGTAGALEEIASGADRASAVSILRLPFNQGQAAARNAGWGVAREEYVAFLDADDTWHPRKLELQFDWMARRPSVVLTGHRTVRIQGGERFDGPLPSGWRARRIRPLEMLLSNRIHMRSAMVRREAPYRFDPGMRTGEDYLLWLEMVLDGCETWLLDLPLAFYFKALYGGGGVSGNLRAMEAGELKAYDKLHRKGLLPLYGLPFLWAFSLAKYAVRHVVKR